MKHPFSIWILSAVACLAAELEIRSYQVAPSTLRQAYWTAVEDHDVDFDQKDWLGLIVEKAPFQSRFLQDAKVLRNVTSRIGEMIGVKKFEGAAVYHEEEQRLVVQSKVRWHESIKRHLDRHMIWNLRTEISIYQVPGVLRKKRDLLRMTPPEYAELLTSLTCLHIPGQDYVAQTPSGDLTVEMESQVDGDYEYAEIRTNITINHPEVRALWKTGFLLPAGTFTVHEVGSPDGKTTVLAALKTDMTTTSGVLLDNWIEKEKEGFFLLKQRLAGLQHHNFIEKKDLIEEGYCQISVVPTFASFIMSAANGGESDPFAAEADNRFRAPYFDLMPPELRDFESASLLDLREVMMKNGLTFRQGDFVAFDEIENQIYVKLSDIQLELLEGIITPAGLGPPRNISIDLLEVEITGSTTQWKPGEGKILRKMGIPLLQGQTTTAQLGENLRAEIEFHIDSYDELLEVGMTLFENGNFEKVNLKSSFTVQNNVPLVIKENRTSTQHRAWILTARVLAIDHEIRDLLERSEEGR